MEHFDWTENNIKELTEKELLSSDLIRQLYDDFAEDPLERGAVAAQLKMQAKKYKCLSAFSDLVKVMEKQEKAEAKPAERNGGNNNNVVSFPLGEGKNVIAKTGKWIVDKYGVQTLGFTGPLVASNYPIIITRTLTDYNTGKEDVELTWKKDGAVRSMQVPRSYVSSNTKIVSLSDNGVPVTSTSANLLINYLADYEKLNTDIIEHQTSTRHFGWILRGDSKEFLPYTDSDIKLNYSWMDDQLTKAMKKAGNISDWLDAYLPMRASGRHDFNMMIAASLASVLVPIVGISPFIVCLYGKTGGGKTVSLMFCASIWGEPRPQLMESNSTLNALVKRLGTLNHLPMFVDDLSKIRDKGDGDKYTDFIYTLCAGKEKSRLTRTLDMRDAATWSNVIMTNMERPLSGYDNMNGGAINRVLDVEMLPGDMFPDGNATVRAISRNYGQLGGLYIQHVIEHYDEIQGMADDFEDKIKAIAADQGHEKEQKQIMPMALILTADKLLADLIGEDPVLDIEWCVDRLKNVDDVSEMQRAWNALQDELTINTGKFNPIVDSNGNLKYPTGCWGVEQFDRFAIIPSALDRIADEHNFSSRQFLGWAKKEGVLEAGDGRNLAKKVMIPGTERRARCYVFLKPEPDEKTETDEDYQIPPVFTNSQTINNDVDDKTKQLDIKF